MFSSLKNKPNAQEIISNNPAARRENITQRVMYSVKICLTGKEVRKVGAENLKAPDFHNGTQSACDDEKQNLFLT